MKNYLVIGAILLLLIAGFIIWKLSSPRSVPSESAQRTQQQPSTKSAEDNTFANPKKSAHYETNTPSHGVTLAGVPINVVIDFNFDLAKPSEIKILKEETDYGVGETVIDPNKLAMRRNVKVDAPDGVYKVEYNACWPDGSCHDGYFQFAIDRKLADSFTDQTGKKEITINLANIKFVPQDIKISQGTKITWVNDDSVEHYINTESHPAHTYSLPQNSKVLKKGESFSLTFDKGGIYPYHCSAHASTMVGNILVE